MFKIVGLRLASRKKCSVSRRLRRCFHNGELGMEGLSHWDDYNEDGKDNDDGCTSAAGLLVAAAWSTAVHLAPIIIQEAQFS
jgi:hypothetical protein